MHSPRRVSRAPRGRNRRPRTPLLLPRRPTPTAFDPHPRRGTQGAILVGTLSATAVLANPAARAVLCGAGRSSVGPRLRTSGGGVTVARGVAAQIKSGGALGPPPLWSGQGTARDLEPRLLASLLSASAAAGHLARQLQRSVALGTHRLSVLARGVPSDDARGADSSEVALRLAVDIAVDLDPLGNEGAGGDLGSAPRDLARGLAAGGVLVLDAEGCDVGFGEGVVELAGAGGPLDASPPPSSPSQSPESLMRVSAGGGLDSHGHFRYGAPTTGPDPLDRDPPPPPGTLALRLGVANLPHPDKASPLSSSSLPIPFLSSSPSLSHSYCVCVCVCVCLCVCVCVCVCVFSV